MRFLKPVRVIVAFIFFLSTSLLFIDITGIIPAKVYDVLLSVQYLPSLFKLIRGVSWIAIGFFLFTLLSFIFGRIYCSSICPLGILQDFFIRLNRLFFRNRKLKHSYKHSLPWLRHVVFVLALISLLFSSTGFIIWVDPYSIYGRIATHMLQPIIIIVNNVVAHFANGWGWFGLYNIELKAFHLVSFIFSFSIFILLLMLTRYRGRLFCNTLCPVGALLGKLSTLSLFKLQFTEHKCISCGKCERICKSDCIDYKDMKIDFDRCVTCFNCISVCPEEAIGYKLLVKSKVQTLSKSRRNAIKTIGVSGAALAGLPKLLKAQETKSSFISTTPTKSLTPVTPPGSISLQHFKETCTACHLCVSVCPTNVIQASFIEYGIDGMFIPKMDYNVDYCQYECNLCGQVCPTGAIKPLMLEVKKQVQMGKVTFIKDNCVVTQNNQDCGACAEHCPTKAVRMVPYNETLFIPEVNPDLCVGCGACEHPCPVRPYKAIYVEANPVHALSEIPQIKDEEQKTEVDEEFPF